MHYRVVLRRDPYVTRADLRRARWASVILFPVDGDLPAEAAAVARIR
jgi:hypothetical protein